MKKMNGIDWITIGMLSGAKPIILKAPKLFGRRLIYIEKEEGEDRFSLRRIVDPFTTYRTEPKIVTEGIVREAIATFRIDGEQELAPEEYQSYFGNNGRG